MAQVLIRHQNVLISFLLLAFVNVGPLIIPSIMTVPVQLILSSCSCVYIGCSLSSKVVKTDNGTIIKGQKGADEQTVTKEDALRFPITASIFLLSLYLLYKYVSADLVNFLLTFQFCLLTVIAMANLISPFLPFSQSSKKVFWNWKASKWLKQFLDFPDISLSTATILTSLLCSIPVIVYYFTKYWILNNLFGILFSIVAIRAMNLGSFYVGFLLLWLLFFYDIFWVYGTDVMVTVAKNLDIPIKLLFPYYNAQGQWKFSMLGLGDIVLPGIFVSICLKYDVDKSLKQGVKNISDIKLTYFNICFVGYILGIVETFAALKIFNHAQPALLFLVPMCTLPVLIKSLISGEFEQLKSYESDKKQTKQQEKKKQQKTQ